VGGELSHTTITQVLHVPKMKISLNSVSKLIYEGFKVELDKDGCKVNDAQGVVMAETRRDKNLYLLNVKVRKDTTHIANSLDEGLSLESFQQGLQLCFRSHLNPRSSKKGYGPPKSWESKFQEFQGFQLGSLKTK